MELVFSLGYLLQSDELEKLGSRLIAPIYFDWKSTPLIFIAETNLKRELNVPTYGPGKTR